MFYNISIKKQIILGTFFFVSGLIALLFFSFDFSQSSQQIGLMAFGLLSFFYLIPALHVLSDYYRPSYSTFSPTESIQLHPNSRHLDNVAQFLRIKPFLLSMLPSDTKPIVITLFSNQSPSGLAAPGHLHHDIYATEALSDTELTALIAHEIGHLLRRHERFSIIVPLITVCFSISSLVLLSFVSDPYFATIFYATVFLTVSLNQFLSRLTHWVAEYQADSFARSFGLQTTMTNLLLKSAALRQFSVFEDSQTHPSVFRRAVSLSRIEPLF